MYNINAARLIPEIKVTTALLPQYFSVDNSNVGELQMLIQSELKRLLHYDPNTGIFTRLVEVGNSINIGDIAGTILGSGYEGIRVLGKSYLAHRLAWLYTHGEWPKNQIDHVNHNKLDNRIINLREVTQQENTKNQALYKNNKSGVAGVHWCKISKKWVVQVGIRKKRIKLGYFLDKFEAICARKSAEKKYGYHENHGAAK